MKKFILLLLLSCILLSGCSSESLTSAETTTEEDTVMDVKVKEILSTEENMSETVLSEEDMQMGVDAVEDYLPNPYKGITEVYNPWRYDVFEIARNSDKLNFGGTLHNTKSFSAMIPDDYDSNLPDHNHEFECCITLPQTEEKEPWLEEINSYYQDLLPDLIAEGDKIWKENIDNRHVISLKYYYEADFQYGNVVNVVRSRHLYGSRPSVTWEPFTDMFSAIDGQPISLDDLFCVDKEVYMPVLHSSLANASLCFAQYYDPDRDDDFKVYPDNPSRSFDRANVAVTSFGLVFIYPTGSVTDMSASTVFLKVPYEDLMGLLNSTYFPE